MNKYSELIREIESNLLLNSGVILEKSDILNDVLKCKKKFINVLLSLLEINKIKNLNTLFNLAYNVDIIVYLLERFKELLLTDIDSVKQLSFLNFFSLTIKNINFLIGEIVDDSNLDVFTRLFYTINNINILDEILLDDDQKNIINIIDSKLNYFNKITLKLFLEIFIINRE